MKRIIITLIGFIALAGCSGGGQDPDDAFVEAFLKVSVTDLQEASDYVGDATFFFQSSDYDLAGFAAKRVSDEYADLAVLATAQPGSGSAVGIQTIAAMEFCSDTWLDMAYALSNADFIALGEANDSLSECLAMKDALPFP